MLLLYWPLIWFRRWPLIWLRNWLINWFRSGIHRPRAACIHWLWSWLVNFLPLWWWRCWAGILFAYSNCWTDTRSWIYDRRWNFIWDRFSERLICLTGGSWRHRTGLVIFLYTGWSGSDCTRRNFRFRYRSVSIHGRYIILINRWNRVIQGILVLFNASLIQSWSRLIYFLTSLWRSILVNFLTRWSWYDGW